MSVDKKEILKTFFGVVGCILAFVCVMGVVFVVFVCVIQIV